MFGIGGVCGVGGVPKAKGNVNRKQHLLVCNFSVELTRFIFNYIVKK